MCSKKAVNSLNFTTFGGFCFHGRQNFGVLLKTYYAENKRKGNDRVISTTTNVKASLSDQLAMLTIQFGALNNSKWSFTAGSRILFSFSKCGRFRYFALKLPTLLLY